MVKSENELDIELIDELLKLYLILIEPLYDKQNLIPNAHQLEYILEHYLNYGPLSLNNSFLFESYNGLIKSMPKGSYGALLSFLNRFE